METCRNERTGSQDQAMVQGNGFNNGLNLDASGFVP